MQNDWVPTVVLVQLQSSKGKKGAALREGIGFAAELLKDTGGFIALQEPEKLEMMSRWREIVDFMIQEKADICNPRRATQSFIHTYPIEQWHSEQFGNLYLDSLAHQVGFPSVDGTMGPIVLSATFADHWLHFEGELWDAQIVSKVRAQRWHGAKVSSYEFDYKHHLAMKGEEEGVPKWTEKHLFQLNFLFEHVGIALKETEESR